MMRSNGASFPRLVSASYALRFLAQQLLTGPRDGLVVREHGHEHGPEIASVAHPPLRQHGPSGFALQWSSWVPR